MLSPMTVMASTRPMSDWAAACTSADVPAVASTISRPSEGAYFFSAFTRKTEFDSPAL